MANSKLRIIYRSNSHAPLWLVAEKSGVWEKNGLTVDTSPELVREKAVEALKNGHVDLISGNHHNLFVRNAKNGEDFVHLAQAGNNWTENRLVVTDGIRSVKDLRGKRVVADKLNSHAGLNIWLFLRQEGLDTDRGDVELVEIVTPGVNPNVTAKFVLSLAVISSPPFRTNSCRCSTPLQPRPGRMSSRCERCP